jgi:hypothetical protein
MALKPALIVILPGFSYKQGFIFGISKSKVQYLSWTSFVVGDLSPKHVVCSRRFIAYHFSTTNERN